jgi:peptidoglycan-N-acetylglucosamine deacetylase
MAGPLLASISVDLDPLACYYRIHALRGAPPAGGLVDVVIRRSVPRFLETFARHGVRATFFIVGSDLAGGTRAAQAARALVRELVGAGHEVGNHSFSHPYDLAHRSVAQVCEEIRRADGEIAGAAGTRLEGFRAPGYDVSPVMLDEITRLGYSYDSSIFPAPGYYAAKAVVMASLRLLGRRSGAVLTNPRALLAPADPYRPDADAPWRRGQATVVELPIAVTPGLRIPAIGTNLLLAPTSVRASWLDQMRRRPFFNLELHGIDLIDAGDDGIPSALVARQPDLRAPLVAKRRALEATLDRLSLDYRFATLREIAAQVQRQGGLGDGVARRGRRRMSAY